MGRILLFMINILKRFLDICDNLEFILGFLINLRSIVGGYGINKLNFGRWFCIFGIFLLKKDVICKKCMFFFIFCYSDRLF